MEAVCDYWTDDHGITMLAYCTAYAGVDEARETMTERMYREPQPYPVGDEGLVMEDSFPDMDPPAVGAAALVRSGSTVCELQYHVNDANEPPDWGDDALEFLATSTLP